jgi:hypothetical protein
MKTRLLAPLVVVALASAPRLARAEKQDACIAAYEQTQTLRKDGKLVAAKTEAALCARAECPALLTKDCSRWLGELEASTPSIVFEARTSKGAERADVKVKVDGQPFVDKLDGRAVSIDPGNRVFRFEPEGGFPFEKTILVREGEKNRRVKITIVETDESRPPAAPRPVPLGVWLFGGASVIALGTSVVFAIDGFGKKSDLDACKPRCPASDVDAMSARFTIADVALGAGIVAGAAAVWLYVTRPPAEPERTPVARRTPFVVPLPSGAAAGLGGTF